MIGFQSIFVEGVGDGAPLLLPNVITLSDRHTLMREDDITFCFKPERVNSVYKLIFGRY